MHLVAPAFQALCHKVGRGVFLVGKFRVGVDLVAQLDHLVFVAADLCEGGQGQGSVHGTNQVSVGAAILPRLPCLRLLVFPGASRKRRVARQRILARMNCRGKRA